MNFFSSISVKLTIFTLILFIILFGSFGIYSYNIEKKNIEIQFYNFGKSLLNIYVPLFERALRFKDDILLISYIQNIIELQNVQYSMILSNDGIIIAHNKPSEIGKKYEDEISKEIIRTNKFNILKHKIQNLKYIIYEFSHSLENTNAEKIAVLRIGISEHKIKKDLKNSIERYFIFIFIFIFLICTSMYFFSDYIITPVNKLNNSMKKIAKLEFSDEIKIKTKDEFYNLAESVKYAIGEIKKNQQEKDQQITTLEDNFQNYLKIIGTFFDSGIVLTDRENKIIYFNEKAKEIMFIKEQEPLFKHIFEVNRNVELSELIKKSIENSNFVLKEEFKSSNYKVKIITIKDSSNNLVGTIIQMGT